MPKKRSKKGSFLGGPGGVKKRAKNPKNFQTPGPPCTKAPLDFFGRSGGGFSPENRDPPPPFLHIQALLREDFWGGFWGSILGGPGGVEKRSKIGVPGPVVAPAQFCRRNGTDTAPY